MGVQVIILSNRVCDLKDEAPIEGGLASALSHPVRQSGAIWIGTRERPGGITQAKPLVDFRRAGQGSIGRADIPSDIYQRFYAGFANSALWPVLHSRPDLIRIAAEDYTAYREVNRRMAEAVLATAQDDTLIWVHDYHFLTVAEELRSRGSRNPAGFFLHTPFPARQTLLSLPNHREIVRAMLHFQLIGFQTEPDKRNFEHYLSNELGLALNGDVVLQSGTRLGCFPVGIDAGDFARNASEAAAGPDITRLRATLQSSKLMIGVDRIDYSKGIDNRLRAVDHLLASEPALKRQISYLQIALPCRQQIAAYHNLHNELAVRVSEINGRHGEIDWMPIRYLNKGFPQAKLAGLYRSAAVGLVTPMHDGMNLVAKEYVAAQDPANPGVLVLSEFAGSAQQLAAALMVNPHDVDAIGRSIRRALGMTLEERKERWTAMMAVIEASGVQTWYAQFVEALSETAPQRERIRPVLRMRSPPMVSTPDVPATPQMAGRTLP